MRAPPLPKDEAARLDDLHAYEVLDTAPEALFEEIAELAATICGTRFAALSLIDRQRQWFKASHGVELTQSARDESICGHAILESDVFEVPNIAADERFVDNPLLRGHPRFRFYAGSQLRSERGHAIGTLCVLDLEPGELSDNQRQALRQLSSLVMAILNSRRRAAETHWLSKWIADVSEEVYVRDPDSLRYLYANEAALRRTGCTLAQLRAGSARVVEPEGEDRHFYAYVQRMRAGEPSLAFEATRSTADAGMQQVDVSWSWLSTPTHSAILSIVRERR